MKKQTNLPTLARKGSAPKKTSFSDREYVNQAPSEDDIALKDDGVRYLPIDVIERDLDRWIWSTQNFRYQLLKDKLGNLCIDATLELVIPWNEDGQKIQRVLIGCCNFPTASYAPNVHYVATAKSECVKNAASDLGKRFGRGLNHEKIAGVSQTGSLVLSTEKAKRKPDKGILEEFKKARERGDETALQILNSIYEFNIQENGNETI